jgi:glycosyltransferase involved in cell wall biosynthesis
MPQVSMPQVSVVVPFFNEAASLEQLARELREVLAAQRIDAEIIAVDDGSTDGGRQLMERIAGADPRFRVLAHARNLGQAAALLTGFAAARAPITVTLDADLQNRPADIPRLLEGLEGCDMVSGVRVDRQDVWSKRLASRIANTVRIWMLQDGVHDVGCSLKAYRTALLTDLPAFEGLHRFLPALLRARGASLREVPVGHRPRLHGESHYDLWGRLGRGLRDLYRVRRMIRGGTLRSRSRPGQKGP